MKLQHIIFSIFVALSLQVTYVVAQSKAVNNRQDKEDFRQRAVSVIQEHFSSDIELQALLRTYEETASTEKKNMFMAIWAYVDQTMQPKVKYSDEKTKSVLREFFRLCEESWKEEKK